VAVLPTIVVTQPSCTVYLWNYFCYFSAAEYSFDDGLTWGTNSSISNLPVGQYIVKIKSVAGCFLSGYDKYGIFFISWLWCSWSNFCGGFGQYNSKHGC
jgi:hypothetical protein